MRKKWIALVVAAALCLCLFGCSSTQTEQEQTTTTPVEQLGTDQIVILYTSDIHGNFYQNSQTGAMGYAAVATYANELKAQGYTVVLVDGGDAACKDMTGTISNASQMIDVMKLTNYKFAVPGAGEFDRGVDAFVELAKESGLYYCCNLVDSSTGETALTPYRMIDCAAMKLAFVGVCSPSAMTGSGSYELLDGQQLLNSVQNAVNLARAEGADMVFAVGPVGTTGTSEQITSTYIIAYTTGLSGFLGGLDHGVIEGHSIVGPTDEDVLLASVGADMIHLAEIRVNVLDGSMTFSLVSGLTEEDRDVLVGILDPEQIVLPEEDEPVEIEE